MTFNPFGPGSRTAKGDFASRNCYEGRDINKVCGVDYVADFNEWLEEFDKLVSLE